MPRVLVTCTSKRPILTCKPRSRRVQKVFTDLNSNMHTVFLGYEQTCTWQLFLHSAPQENDEPRPQEIVGHDVITIKHSELEGYLCSSISFQGDSPEIYFRCYKGSTPEEVISVGM